MAILTGQFERVAEAVVERITDLIAAQVLVTNERGVVIAGGEPGAIGLPIEVAGPAFDTGCLRIPFHLNGQTGEVFVTSLADGEVMSQRVAQAMVELVINQTLVVSGLPNQHELKNKFIHDLLRGPIGNVEDVLREGQILGMDLNRPRAVILIDAADYVLQTAGSGLLGTSEEQIRRRVQKVINSVVSFFQLPNDTICAYIGDGEVAVLKATSTQDLGPWSEREDVSSQANPSWANLSALKRAGSALLLRLRSDTRSSINIGIGRHHPGIHGLARSYQDACAALSLGRRFHGHNQVHCLDGLGMAAFVGVSDERTKVELARHLLSPLDQEPELFETLDVFFAQNCCPSSTASQLFIHRNTLSYRLDKITSLAGLDPRKFDDAVQIRLAIVMRSLRSTLN